MSTIGPVKPSVPTFGLSIIESGSFKRSITLPLRVPVSATTQTPKHVTLRKREREIHHLFYP